jgi:hypothetical protein
MIFCAFEALVGYVGSRGGTPRAPEPSIRLMAHGEEGFGHLLVGGGSGPEAEARYDSHGIDGYKQPKTLLPSQTVGPPDVRVAREPSGAPALGVPDGHRRAIQRLVGTLPSPHNLRQVQRKPPPLDEIEVISNQTVELRTIGQGGGKASRRWLCA